MSNKSARTKFVKRLARSARVNAKTNSACLSQLLHSSFALCSAMPSKGKLKTEGHKLSPWIGLGIYFCKTLPRLALCGVTFLAIKRARHGPEKAVFAGKHNSILAGRQ